MPVFFQLDNLAFQLIHEKENPHRGHPARARGSAKNVVTDSFFDAANLSMKACEEDPDIDKESQCPDDGTGRR